MPRLLVINPNTSQRVSRSIDSLVREEAGAEIEVQTVTAAFGFRYIASRTALAIAAHAALDAAAEVLTAGPVPDAIVLGCFGDPGLDALAEMTGIPVVGFAEAGFFAATADEGKIVVATRGQVWCNMLEDLAEGLGLAEQVAGVYSIEGAGEDPRAIAAFLEQRARETGASRIVLGGAGLIPLLPQVIAASSVPVIDPHRAAVRKAVAIATRGRRPASDGDARGETTGLSPALTRALTPEAVAALEIGNAH
jgi:Asp/Glu/hydantoin racemase